MLEHEYARGDGESVKHHARRMLDRARELAVRFPNTPFFQNELRWHREELARVCHRIASKGSVA